MFFLQLKSEYQLERTQKFSKSETIQYILILIFFLILILIALVVFNNIYNILFALWVLLFAQIYFCFYWIKHEMHFIEKHYATIKKNFKKKFYIKNNIEDLIYSSKSLDSEIIRKEFEELKHLNNNFINSNSILLLIYHVNKMQTNIEQIAFSNKNDKYYQSILLKSLNNLKEKLYNQNHISSEIKTEIILNSSVNPLNKNTNLFLNSVYNLSEMFLFFQKYNEIKLFSNLFFKRKFPKQSKKKYNIGLYDIQEFEIKELQENHFSYKKITSNNIIINIYFYKDKIINIQTFENEILIEDINFVDSWPIFKIQNRYYLITDQGSLELERKNNKYYGKAFIVSSNIAYDNIYRQNEYISNLIKINFKNRSISINNQEKISI